jgi:hypothetical protein
MNIIAKKISDGLSCFIEISDESPHGSVILSKSENSSLECKIEHKYDGLEYIVYPNSDEVLITFESLKSKFSKI